MWELGLGGVGSFFQDTKYSDVRYGGGGMVFLFDRTAVAEKYVSNYNVTVGFGGESASTHDADFVSVIHTALSYRYLRSIHGVWRLGGQLDALDYYLRNSNNLGNNGTYSITGSQLWASVQHDLSVKERPLTLGADVGVLTYFRESTGFAFSIPQDAQEKGEFSYQNESVTSFFSFRNGTFAPLWDRLNFRFRAQYELHRRWAIGYQWQFARFATVTNYPTAYGQHRLNLHFRFVHKTTLKPAS